ncbi:MAG: AbrB/MazE/SpoVT family DNA-binding domain-containing protein [Desulfobacteraceae bacterium]|nr:MAG: AbrB/MazE/SpoVT family DNA-binding domain-containing protein [Desulfobacteraceae bacterium]
MAKARVFRSGNSQAVRLPKEFHIEANEVDIFKRGGDIILRPRPQSWKEYFSQGRRFTDDYPDRIEDYSPEERDEM